LFAFKLLAGLLLGALAAISHSLWPCVAVQWLSSWHALASTWLQTNRHMDWVERQAAPPADDSSHEAQASPALPADIRRSLFRFFCAFDSEQRSSLSIPDVQRAVSFAFWHSESPPSQEQVRQLALGMQSDDEGGVSTLNYDGRNPGDDGERNQRLTFGEFLEVMLALRRRSSFKSSP
jgi:hypothetical protein